MKAINWIKENYILTTILLIAAILRLYHINFQSVWLDEIHTINEADPQKSISEIFDVLMIAEPHPPLYFLIVHYAFVIFGYTTMVARMVSAIIGIVGIYSVYLLGNELFNKKVALYAAVLIAFNYFHLYYSQDARMYGLLFMMTSFSFTYLVKFIKKPTYKSAILHAVFANLMIYCHFFGLFALVSQFLILLYFVINPFQITRKKFLEYCVISGLTTLILYIPTYKLFAKTTEIKSIWIQMPSLDVYTQFFKDFFGQSEIVLVFVILLIFLFFMQLFKEKNIEKCQINPNKDKLVFGFFVLFLWIIVTLILPLIRTYTTLPMLVNRYFISILPAIILIVAIGLTYIENKIVRHGILSIILLFSITDIAVVKKYYTQPNKTQFREATQFILDNNVDNNPVVTSLSWYYPFFLNNDKIKTEIIDNTLDNFVTQMVQDTTKKRSFWYIDAHNRPFKISENTQKYLDENFNLESSIDLYDTWAKHYTLASSKAVEVDISKFLPLKDRNGDGINYVIEIFEVSPETLKISGWAYLEGQESVNSKINIVLINGGKAYKLQSQPIKRADVTTYFKSEMDLSNSGFDTKGFLKKYPKGKYQLAIIIENNGLNKKGLVLTDKTIENN